MELMMPFTYKDNSTLINGLAVAGFAGIAILLFPSKEKKMPLDPFSQIGTTAKQCVNDRVACAGGFVEMLGGRVLRIVNTRAGDSSQSWTYSIFVMDAQGARDGYPPRDVVRIILPNDHAWNDYAVRHAKHHIAPKK